MVVISTWNNPWLLIETLIWFSNPTAPHLSATDQPFEEEEEEEEEKEEEEKSQEKLYIRDWGQPL